MLKLKALDLKNEKVNTLIVPVCQDEGTIERIHEDAAILSLIEKAMALPEFKGETDDEVAFYSPADVNAERVVLMGLGKREKLDAESFRKLSGKAVKKSIQKDLEEILLAVPADGKTGLALADLLQALMEGACLGNHIFDRYKEEKKKKPLREIGFRVDAKTAEAHGQLAGRIMATCEGTLLARNWVSLPANDKRPEVYAEAVRSQAEAAGLAVSVLDETDLAEKGFGALLAVSQGSESKPRLVILEYRAEGAEKTVALVGKGVTFDTGGLNLKVGGSMTDMKTDMAGSAAVAGALIAAAGLKPDCNVIGLLPLVENMPSGSAIRPGDIIRSYSGKTVEIGNTDAEGRLILIDTIAYAVDAYHPDVLIDLATLTGACLMALGEKFAAVFSHDDDLAEAIVAAGVRTHERCWRMPLPEDYKELLKSEFADINNMPSTRWGGAITAALFLSEFVKDARWAHIDIAGPVYDKKGNAYSPPGGTGFGVRLICDLLSKL